MKTIATCKEECRQKPWCMLSIYAEYFVSMDFICPCSICLVKGVCSNRCAERIGISGGVVIKAKEIQKSKCPNY